MNEKWINGSEYVEIEHVISVDCGQAIIVTSNAFENALPIGWRAAIPDSSPEEQSQLITSVRQWAEDNGFSLAR